MNYTPGKGGGAIATVVGGGGAIAGITQLPQTGSGLSNEIALVLVAALLAWGLAYMKLRRRSV